MSAENQGIVDFALSGSNAADAECHSVVVRLNARQNLSFLELVEVLGASVEYTLNMAVRYAIYVASVRQIKVVQMPEYSRKSPRKFGLKKYDFVTTFQTDESLAKAGVLPADVAKVALCGVILLHKQLIQSAK